MSQVIMIGCDLHDRNMLLRYAVGTAEPQQLDFVNSATGRDKMIGRIKSIAKKHDASRMVFAYEASAQGYGLSDLLHEQGIECHVLSPTHLPRTAKSAKQKTDAKDAQMLLEQVRGFVLAGNRLPVVWTPPQRLRDDRELVRARVDVANETTRVKLKILSMLKRYGIAKPDWYTSRWSRRFVRWLGKLAGGLDPVVSAVLAQLIERYEFYIKEQGNLDRALRKLSQEDRYWLPFGELIQIPGVGLLSAMTFLTEMGDLTRFNNRREVAAYLGLAPASYESGASNNRKGRITRQGPSRLRKMLCQSAWVSVIHDEEASTAYHRIKQGQSKRTKKALVALMRKLGIKMWHRARSCGVSAELTGRGGPHELATSTRAQQRDTVDPFAPPSLQPQGCAG